MGSELLWYAFGLCLLFIAALGTKRALIWIFTPPYTRSKSRALNGLCGFLFAVLLYAWLLDSHRVAYHEEGLWIFLAVGAVGMAVLSLVANKEN